jgi:hypothetical protein
MKYIVLALAAVFLAGCAAAPPPVKIASHLLGRNVLQQAKDEVFNADSNQATSQNNNPEQDAR